jgi:hypothetical protein
MSRTFEVTIDKLSEVSGYAWDFLVDLYNEMIEDGEDDWEYFVNCSAERDWAVHSMIDLRPEERDVFRRIGEQAWMRLANPAAARILL